MASAAVAHAAHSAGTSNKAVRNDRAQMLLGDGVNPIAAYSQSLADNNVRLIKVDDETPVWAQSQSDPQAQATAVLPSRAAGPNDVNGESTRYDHVKSRIKSKVMRNNPASDNTHGLQLDLGPGFGVSMLDDRKQDDSEDAYTSMPNSASKARANGLAYGPGSDLGTPDLTQSESRPSLSSASTTETSNSKSNTHVNGFADGESDAKGKARDHDFGSQESPSDPSYDHKSQLGSDAQTTETSGQRDGLALSDLPSPVSSSSSGAPIETRLPKGSRDGLTVNTTNALSSPSAAPAAAAAAGDSISAVVIPPTPPTTTSTTGSPTSDYSTPVKTSPRPTNNSLLAPGPLQKQQQIPGKQRSPALHTRSLSYQNATASTSSASPSLSASTGSFPVRRSSLFPPSSPSAYTSALPESSSSAGLRNKRGSLSPQPKRTLSFRGAFSPGSSSHPLQQEVFSDEPISLEQQAEQQRQTEELEDSIARQAEQIRKERASKRQDAERAQVKAALLQHQQQNQPPLAPLRIDTLGSVPKELKGKERERDNNRLEINIPQPASSSGKPLPNIQQEIDKQASPVTPTSPTGYLWNSPVAGEGALVRSPVEGHFPSPTTAHAQLSTSQGPGARQGSAPVLVGNLIGEDHVNYILMYNMLTGIRIGVSRCEAKIQRPLTDEDYKAAHKFSFDIVGNELTPSARYDFKFKDYAPWVFRELRQWFHLDPADYLLSLTAKYILSELGSPGKSGSFFYFSRDYRFIIKTISHTEHKFLRKILKNYHQHVIDNPHTLISRFYGLHRVKLPRGRKIHFVIMNNLFPPHRDIHETFDLKGSSIGREYPEEKAKEKPRATLKDLNWIHRGRQLEVGPQKKQLFEDQLKRDVLFLQAMHIMDYSLLVGIHDLRRGNSENLRDGLLTVFQPEQGKLRRRPTIRGDLERQHEASELRKAVQRSDPKALRNSKLPDKDRSERRHFIFYQDEGGMRAANEWDKDENTIYYLGIIDILTPYNLYKRTEHFFRSFKYDQHRISAVPPEEYGNRFLDFLCSIVRGGDVSRRPKME